MSVNNTATFSVVIGTLRTAARLHGNTVSRSPAQPHGAPTLESSVPEHATPNLGVRYHRPPGLGRVNDACSHHGKIGPWV